LGHKFKGKLQEKKVPSTKPLIEPVIFGGISPCIRGRKVLVTDGPMGPSDQLAGQDEAAFRGQNRFPATAARRSLSESGMSSSFNNSITAMLMSNMSMCCHFFWQHK